jgi:DNA polymerase
MHRADIIASGRWHRFTQYALNDNELQRKIFFALAPEFPVSERKIMDRVIRCAIQPEFHVDKALLAQHLVDMAKEKDRLLREAGVTDPSDLRSTPKFEAILKARGVEIEYKPTAAGTTPAFAKTDEFMAKLAEHDDPVVQALAAARLSLRSTIEERRSERILSIANLDWSCYRDGNPPLMPIPLRYSGAHTHRLSGDWLLNMQNLPTGRNGTPTKLRKAIKAPPGHKVLVADLAQIECRINGWLCGQWDLLDVFAKGLDPYAILASGVFGYEIDKNVHKLERFIGKSGVLGLGFRCGASKFYNMVIRSARAMNMDMGPLLNIWTENLAQKTVDTYRAQNRQIYNTWYRLDEILESAWVGKGDPVRFGPTVIGEGYVHLPSDLKMNYAVENRDLAQGDLTYRYGKVLHKIHGGVLLENIVQALARIVLMNAALRLWDRHLPFKLQAHDELGFILPDAAVWRDAKGKPAGPAVEILKRELKRPPSWAPNLPLDCEIGFGESYGDAK